jgi:hypothetical protein
MQSGDRDAGSRQKKKNGFSNLEKHVSLFKGVKQKVEE